MIVKRIKCDHCDVVWTSTVVDFKKPYFALIGVHYRDQESYTSPGFGNVQIIPLESITLAEAEDELRKYVNETEDWIKNALVIDNSGVTHVVSFADTNLAAGGERDG